MRSVWSIVVHMVWRIVGRKWNDSDRAHNVMWWHLQMDGLHQLLWLSFRMSQSDAGGIEESLAETGPSNAVGPRGKPGRGWSRVGARPSWLSFWRSPAETGAKPEGARQWCPSNRISGTVDPAADSLLSCKDHWHPWDSSERAQWCWKAEWRRGRLGRKWAGRPPRRPAPRPRLPATACKVKEQRTGSSAARTQIPRINDRVRRAALVMARARQLAGDHMQSSTIRRPTLMRL